MGYQKKFDNLKDAQKCALLLKKSGKRDVSIIKSPENRQDPESPISYYVESPPGMIRPTEEEIKV